MNQSNSPKFSTMPSLASASAVVSVRGTHRDENQDSHVVEDGLWIIADGMGGHVGGHVASATAVAAVRASVARDADVEDLGRAVEVAHDMVVAVGEATDEDEMGSTIVVALRDRVHPHFVRVAWCGDSRAYHLTQSGLRRLTRDHNVAEEERASRGLAHDEVWDHPGQHILTSALGCGSPSIPDIGTRRVVARGRLLLCTDGLTAGLRDHEIAELLGIATADDAAQLLVSAAVSLGSTDDTTVIVVDLD